MGACRLVECISLSGAVALDVKPSEAAVTSYQLYANQISIIEP